MKNHRIQGSLSALFLGFVMMCIGGYLLLHSIIVTQSFTFGMGLYTFSGLGGMTITSGMILIPMLIGVGMLFYKPDNLLAWALALGSLAALIGGVIVSTHFSLRSMSLFELLTILILLVGGLGLFLRAYAGLKRSQGV